VQLLKVPLPDVGAIPIGYLHLAEGQISGILVISLAPRPVYQRLALPWSLVSLREASDHAVLHSPLGRSVGFFRHSYQSFGGIPLIDDVERRWAGRWRDKDHGTVIMLGPCRSRDPF
jgi:hypothetical protein